jgi:hypothetical protein
VIPCTEAPETFWTLLHDAAHWEFELFLMLVFDGVLGALLWPFVKKHWGHHVERDRKEGVDDADHQGTTHSRGKSVWQKVSSGEIETMLLFRRSRIAFTYNGHRYRGTLLGKDAQGFGDVFLDDTRGKIFLKWGLGLRTDCEIEVETAS